MLLLDILYCELEAPCVFVSNNIVGCLYSDVHKSPFANMIDLVSDHLENDGELLSQEDVLKVVRPICTNFGIRTDLKMELLQILEKSFELDDDDVFLLVYYQSDAIISATWARNVRFVIIYSLYSQFY